MLYSELSQFKPKIRHFYPTGIVKYWESYRGMFSWHGTVKPGFPDPSFSIARLLSSQKNPSHFIPHRFFGGDSLWKYLAQFWHIILRSEKANCSLPVFLPSPFLYYDHLQFPLKWWLAPYIFNELLNNTTSMAIKVSRKAWIKCYKCSEDGPV